MKKEITVNGITYTITVELDYYVERSLDGIRKHRVIVHNYNINKNSEYLIEDLSELKQIEEYLKKVTISTVNEDILKDLGYN